MNTTRLLLLAAASLILSACSPNQGSYHSDTSIYQGYNYGEYQGYMDSDQSQYSNYRQGYDQRDSRQVTVPDSYHVGSRHSPVRHQNRDNSWVRSQNPQGYTIQLSEGSKASAVAGVLTQAPKRDRMATVKSFQNGQVHYRALYGSYHSYNEAQQALKSLPDDLRSRARVKKWSSVQSNY